jgi:hypothetical protein
MVSRHSKCWEIGKVTNLEISCEDMLPSIDVCLHEVCEQARRVNKADAGVPSVGIFVMRCFNRYTESTATALVTLHKGMEE